MSILEPDELTRTDVIEYFIKALPLPLPLEFVPMALYMTHDHHCPAPEGEQADCECGARMWVKSGSIADWGMSITLPRIGARGVREMAEIEANVQRH